MIHPITLETDEPLAGANITALNGTFQVRFCNVGSIFNVFTVQLYYYGLIAVDGQIWFYRINKDVS